MPVGQTHPHAAWRAVTPPHAVRGDRRASTPPPQRLLSARAPPRSLPAEVDKDAAVVVEVLLHTVVQSLDVLLRQEAQHVLLQGPGTLPGNDLHKGRPLGDRLIDDGPEGLVDLRTAATDVMQVNVSFTYLPSSCAYPRAPDAQRDATTNRPLSPPCRTSGSAGDVPPVDVGVGPLTTRCAGLRLASFRRVWAPRSDRIWWRVGAAPSRVCDQLPAGIEYMGRERSVA